MTLRYADTVALVLLESSCIILPQPASWLHKAHQHVDHPARYLQRYSYDLSRQYLCIGRSRSPRPVPRRVMAPVEHGAGGYTGAFSCGQPAAAYGLPILSEAKCCEKYAHETAVL